MTNRDAMTPNHPRLYLVTPPLGEPAAFRPSSMRRSMPPTSPRCCCASTTADERALINCAKAVAALVQRRDVALLLDGEPALAARAGADGAHVTGIEAFAAALPHAQARPHRRRRRLRSRHDAMLAAETGADYVMFGERRPVGSKSGQPPALREIAGAPGLVGGTVRNSLRRLCRKPGRSRPAGRAGADFIALGDWIWTKPEGVAASIAAAAQILTAPALSGASENAS